MSVDRTAERQRALKIAAVALNRAMAGDLEDAASYIKRLDGSNGLIVAIVGWIDTYISTVYPEHEEGQQIAVRWLFTPTGRIETADEVSASMRWAGRLISMRAALDEDGFYSVLHSAPEGGALGDGIMALLHIVAHGISDPATSRVAAGLSPSAVGGEPKATPEKASDPGGGS